MKRTIKFIPLYAVLVFLLCSLSAFSAEIDTGSDTVSGQFLLKYKPAELHSVIDGSVVSSSKTNSVSQTNSVLSSEHTGDVSADADTVYTIPRPDTSNAVNEETDIILENVPKNAQRIDDRYGETIYQVEPDYSQTDDGVAAIAADDTASYANKAVIGEKRSFIISNYATDTTDKYETDSFTCFYISNNCEVFVQDSLKYPDTDKTRISKIISDEFENTVHDYVIDCISSYTGYYNEENGKIIILLEDIKDNYGVDGYGGYTAGYFLSTIKGVLHIDTFPLMRPSSSATASTAPTDESAAYSFPTLAHEFTHLVETAVAGKDSFKNIWFAELFAISTEASLFPEETAESQYNNYLSGTYYIKHGAVLNYKDYKVNYDYSNKNQIIGANYGLLYLFQNYIRGLTLKADGTTKVFSNILNRFSLEDAPETFEAAVLDGVNDTLSELNKSYRFTDFDDLLKSFYIAFTLQEQTDGKYCYISDSDYIKNLTPPYSSYISADRGAGAAIVVPLRNMQYQCENDGCTYVAFSYSGSVPAIRSVSYPDNKFNMIIINNAYYDGCGPLFKLNDNMNIGYNRGSGLYANSDCYSLLSGVCFFSDFDYVTPLRDGQLYIKALQKDTPFNLYCYSISNKDIYDSIVMNLDTTATAFVQSSVYPLSVNNNTVNHYVFLCVCNGVENFNIYSAVYDSETNKLLGVSTANRERINANTLYINIALPTVTFKESQSGNYLLKAFVFDGSKELSPLSAAYEYPFSK